MESPTATVRRGGPVVALLTMIWLLGMLALAWWLFAIGMEGWADHHSNGDARSAELGRRGARVLLLLVVVGAGGPAVIALAAFRFRLMRTGAVYLVGAIAIGLLSLPVAAGAYRTLTPPPPPPPPATGCQEHSGGDTRCPGG